MRKKLSAGILLYRRTRGLAEVFLVHPGGPFWANKDDGAWSIPKGEYETTEDPLTVAKREFHEETGFELRGDCVPLVPVKQPGGKVISAWAVAGDADAGAITSNFFSLEWPPKSGQMKEFPEVDRAEWYDLSRARIKLLPGQRPFLDQLQQLLPSLH